MDLMDGMELHINNRFDEMPAIVTMVEDFGARHKIPGAVINELNLVLDEVLNNIVSYGYPDARDGRIVVRLDYQPGEISAEVHDDGVAFDPVSADVSDLDGTVETRRIGGLGIHFVKELMDHVGYLRVGNENRLVVKKKIPI